MTTYSSIRTRFVFTVGSNFFRSALGFATGMLLARFLGPESYGRMAFLLGTFLAIRALMDLGSSAAFFTFLSQKPRTRRFVAGYFAWLALQLLTAVCVIGLLFPASWISSIWHGEQRSLVLLAFAAAFAQHSVWPAVQQAGEAQRQTHWAQGLGVAVGCVHLVAVVLLWWLGELGLYFIFAAIAVEYVIAAAVLQKRLVYAPRDSKVEPEPVLRKYFAYCLPMVLISLFGFAYEFTDRWLLQRYGGGVEQAYYAVGAQIASISLIATTSILQIFWKEVAEADHQKNYARTAMLYRKVSRLLFLTGAVIAGFLLPWAKELVFLILGAGYVGGATTLAIMCLYPVHQSMGQIGSTMLYATERASLMTVYGIVIQTASMGVTYLVLAPESAVVPGLGLGSEGLAAKMVVMNLISVNGIAYIIAAVRKWPFDWTYQVVGLVGCVGLGWMAKLLVNGIPMPQTVVLALGGILYFLLVAAFVYALPWVAGLTRDELVSDARRVWAGLLRAARPSSQTQG